MNFDYDEKTQELRKKVTEFYREEIPAEKIFFEQLDTQGACWRTPAIMTKFCIAVDDVADYCDKTKSMGIDMVSCDGQPFSDGKKDT